MNFGLEDHQEQLVQTCGDWLDRSWGTSDVVSVDVRKRLWQELEANGWPAMLRPGPDAATVLDAALVVERLARGGCSLPVTSAMVGTRLGEVIEPDKEVASRLLIALQNDDADQEGIEPTARGLDVGTNVMIARSSPTSSGSGPGRRWELAVRPVSNDDVRVVQDEAPLTICGFRDPASLSDIEWFEPDPVVVEHAWLMGAVLSAAELVGLGQSVVDSCAAYAKDRVQGGKPIGGHQAIQHRVADMLGYVERCRYLTYAAAEALTDAVNTGNASGLAGQAKALAGRDCLTTIRSAHQVMGAIGFSAEHELHHIHKQALVAAHEFGSPGHHWTALENAAAPAV